MNAALLNKLILRGTYLTNRTGNKNDQFAKANVLRTEIAAA